MQPLLKPHSAGKINFVHNLQINFKCIKSMTKLCAQTEF
jgi:hypothetical protein